MKLWWMFLFFSLGTIFGSFFNVVGLRLPQKIPFSNERSYCPHCQKQLQWYELIPIASYVLQHGYCKNCYQRISLLYPFIECSTGMLFMLSYWKMDFNFELIIALLLISLLMIVLVTDMIYLVIPDQILLFFLFLMSVISIFNPLFLWKDGLIGAIVGFCLIALIIVLSKGGMGGGDMKLFGVLGFVLGWEKALLTLFLASCSGAVIGGILLGVKRMKRNQPISFGPFIVLATLMSYFYGDQIISMYLAFF